MPSIEPDYDTDPLDVSEADGFIQFAERYHEHRFRALLEVAGLCGCGLHVEDATEETLAVKFTKLQKPNVYLYLEVYQPSRESIAHLETRSGDLTSEHETLAGGVARVAQFMTDSLP
jgi:hypothetical protein